MAAAASSAPPRNSSEVACVGTAVHEMQLLRTIHTTMPSSNLFDKSLRGHSLAFFSTTNVHGALPAMESPYPYDGKGVRHLRVSTTFERCDFFQKGDYYFVHTAEFVSTTGKKSIRHIFLFVPTGRGAPPFNNTPVAISNCSQLFNQYDGKQIIDIAVVGDVDVSGACWKWDCIGCRGSSARDCERDAVDRIACSPLPAPLPWLPVTDSAQQFIYHVTNIPCPKCCSDKLLDYNQRRLDYFGNRIRAAGTTDAADLLVAISELRKITEKAIAAKDAEIAAKSAKIRQLESEATKKAE